MPRLSDLAFAAFLALIAWIALATKHPYVLFPELGALGWVIFSDAGHPWSRSPLPVMVTPLLTGAVGLAVARTLPYGPAAMLLAVAGSLIVVAVLRSPVIPALSAGILPLALGIQSWEYPLSLLIGTAGLALLILLRRSTRQMQGLDDPEGPASERAASGRLPVLGSWLPGYTLFVMGGLLLVHLLGSPLVLFPPLFVMAFERIAHASQCSWRRRPFTVLVTANAAALVGLGLEMTLGVTPLAVFLAALVGVVLLRATRLPFPPALGMVLLPFVIHQPSWLFPVHTLVGTAWLLLLVALWERGFFRRLVAWNRLN